MRICDEVPLSGRKNDSGKTIRATYLFEYIQTSQTGVGESVVSDAVKVYDSGQAYTFTVGLG